MTQTPKKSQSISNHAIENYIQRVSQLSQSEHKIPTNTELEKIATELGISNQEIEIAKQESQNYFIRAKGYFNLKYWQEAINELQEAIVFNPSNLEMLNLLANAHLGRWYEKHNREDELQVKTRIKQCLEIKPDHQESLELLAKLDKSLKEYYQKKVFITALFSIFIGSIIGYYFLGDVSLNIFAKRDVKLTNLKLELLAEINNLRNQQNFLKHELYNNNNKLTYSQQKIKQLQQENKTLRQKIIYLEKQIKDLSK